MDFSEDKVESITSVHYWENIALEFRLCALPFLTCYFFSSLSFTLKANLVTS